MFRTVWPAAAGLAFIVGFFSGLAELLDPDSQSALLRIVASPWFWPNGVVVLLVLALGSLLADRHAERKPAWRASDQQLLDEISETIHEEHEIPWLKWVDFHGSFSEGEDDFLSRLLRLDSTRHEFHAPELKRPWHEMKEKARFLREHISREFYPTERSGVCRPPWRSDSAPDSVLDREKVIAPAMNDAADQLIASHKRLLQHARRLGFTLGPRRLA
jgi:hypothetical protein